MARDRRQQRRREMEMDKMRMLPRKTQPARTAHYTFILWGDNFEEEVATIFATELRRTGVGG